MGEEVAVQQSESCDLEGRAATTCFVAITVAVGKSYRNCDTHAGGSGLVQHRIITFKTSVITLLHKRAN